MNFAKKLFFLLALSCAIVPIQAAIKKKVVALAGIITTIYVTYTLLSYFSHSKNSHIIEPESIATTSKKINIDDITVSEYEDSLPIMTDLYPFYETTTTLTFSTQETGPFGKVIYQPNKTAHIITLQLLLIHPEFRNQKIGSVLLQKTHDHIKEKYHQAGYIIGEPGCVEAITDMTKQETKERLIIWYKKLDLTVQDNGKIVYKIKR